MKTIAFALLLISTPALAQDDPPDANPAWNYQPPPSYSQPSQEPSQEPSYSGQSYSGYGGRMLQSGSEDYNRAWSANH